MSLAQQLEEVVSGARDTIPADDFKVIVKGLQEIVGSGLEERALNVRSALPPWSTLRLSSLSRADSSRSWVKDSAISTIRSRQPPAMAVRREPARVRHRAPPEIGSQRRSPRRCANEDTAAAG